MIRAGYRAPHLVKLANAVAGGELDLESLGSATIDELSDDDLEKQLLALPGVGPYAAAHIMHMLGRCSRLVLDSWTRPTYARLIGVESVADAEIAEQFTAYGTNAGLAFWLTVTRPWFEDHGAIANTGVAPGPRGRHRVDGTCGSMEPADPETSAGAPGTEAAQEAGRATPTFSAVR